MIVARRHAAPALREAEELAFQGTPPFQILMMGLQGSGKTTACGKLALHLRNQFKKKPLLVACDVYRPAAIDQLKVIGKSLGIPVYDEGEGDPVRIAQNGQKFARENGHDLVLYDTAGRLQIDDELMAELERITALVKPQERFFVAVRNAIGAAPAGSPRRAVAEAIARKLEI